MTKKERIICSLDVGTKKICMLVVRADPGNNLEVISSGYALSEGLHKGLVVDLEKAAASIRKAAQEAESKADLSIDWVNVGISGDHMQGYNCHGAIALERKKGEVTPEDVAQVIQAAQSIPIPQSREVIHVLPQEFFLDGRGDIQNPVGLTGSRFDVDIHVVTCETAIIQNIINAVNQAQMRVKEVASQQLASTRAVLTPDEGELGAAVIDIGGGTTDIALVVKNAVRHTSAIPVGGGHFTRDLAVGARCALEDAERIKQDLGTVSTGDIAEDEMIEVPGVVSPGVRLMPRKAAGRILRERGTELLELVKDRIACSGERDQLVAGAILTGGGSMLDGMLDLAEETLEMPVRQGIPHGIKGLGDGLSHPIFATAVGLALIGVQEKSNHRLRPEKKGGAPWFVNRFLSWVGN